MRIMKKLLYVFIIVSLLASAAHASFISLNTTVTSEVRGNILNVSVSVVNKGDEAAHNVQAEVRLGDKKILANKKQELGVGGIYRAKTSFQLNQKPGQYPLVIVMHYADANQYPFSALTVQSFPYKAQAMLSDVFGKGKDATFWEKGSIKFILKNMGDTEIKSSTYLVTPRELTVKEGKQALTIAPKSDQSLKFSVENFSALSGSNYQVFAISEYEKDGVHLTNVTPGMIHLVEQKKVIGIDARYLFVTLVVLVLLFVGFQVYKK